MRWRALTGVGNKKKSGEDRFRELVALSWEPWRGFRLPLRACSPPLRSAPLLVGVPLTVFAYPLINTWRDAVKTP